MYSGMISVAVKMRRFCSDPFSYWAEDNSTPLRNLYIFNMEKLQCGLFTFTPVVSNAPWTCLLTPPWPTFWPTSLLALSGVLVFDIYLIFRRGYEALALESNTCALNGILATSWHIPFYHGISGLHCHLSVLSS